MSARQILESFDRWRSAGVPLVLVTVVETEGSTYTKAGHRILIAAAVVVLGTFLGFTPFDPGYGVLIAGFFLVPIATAVAILKYRLYELDVVVNKAVLFGTLAAFATVVYVAIVVGVGALVGSAGNAVLSAAAAAVVALAFQPARARARRLADHIVYGKRATPYEVLAEFSDRVGGSYAVEEVLTQMALVLGEGTGALLLLIVVPAIVVGVLRGVRIVRVPGAWRWWAPALVVTVWALLAQVAPWNPEHDLSGIDPKILARARKANAPINQEFLKRSAEGKLRWSLTVYPNHAMAQEADMSLRDYTESSTGQVCSTKRSPWNSGMPKLPDNRS